MTDNGYKKGDFCAYMARYAVSKGQDFTHTSIIKPSGSFYIGPDDMDDFMAQYTRAFEAGEDLYMTEKHRDIGPFLIDLDFRFDKETVTSRKYTTEMVDTVVKIYSSLISEYLQVPEDGYHIYLMEKNAPVLDKKYLKDGIHIVIPDIVTTPSVQQIIRLRALEPIGAVLSPLDLKNLITDVIDEAVIDRNNWQMYGSKKPNGEPYKVTRVYKAMSDGDVSTEGVDGVITPELFSIRNKYDATVVKQEKAEDIKVFEETRKKEARMKIDTSKPMFKQNLVRNECENIEWVCKLVDILKPERADTYDGWIRTGWCLRNIDHRLLDKWIDFSRKSPKFSEGECERYWNMMRDDGLGIGTLCMWAKQDNLEAYNHLIEQDLNALIKESTTETHYDIAKVVHFMFKYEYSCVSIKNNMWYEFKCHRWHPCDGAYTLRQRISTEVYRKYMEAIGKVSAAAGIETNADQQKLLQDRIKKLNNIALKLKQSPFKDNIIKECRELFYQEKFEEILDSKCHLIGFENGVYDLEALEFREGRPDDYISMTTRINYMPYDPTHPAVAGINGFISTIFTKSHIKDYVMKVMGSFLNGSIREEKFHIWTGTGCFAKGTGIMMYDGSIKKVEDVVVGDKLMGDDSTPRNVLQLFRGYSDMYRIEPIKGESFVVNGQHDLVVKFAGFEGIAKREYDCFRAEWAEYTGDERVIKMTSRSFKNRDDAAAILEAAKSSSNFVQKNDIIIMTVHQYLLLPIRLRAYLSIYRPEHVHFEKREHKLDPWYVGYWLGNGTSADTSITSAEQEVYDYCKEMADKYNCHISSERKKGLATTFYIAGKEWRNNAILDGLRFYNMINNKHLPNDYKFTDKETRMQVLAGIVDSDGHYQEKMKQIEITFESERLIDDTIWLARSLGFSCYKYKIQKKCCNNGKVGDYFRIQIVGRNLHELPTKVPRKKPMMRSQIKDPLKLSFTVERVSDDNFYGFELSGNRRFLLDNFTITKNSNGKSKLIELFESSFGDYCCKFPVTLLTMKRAVSNAPTPEIARSKGRRFAVLQEPSEDEKMNVGLMKELTGGDKIIARQLHKDPIEFKPQFKMVLTCNHLPNVPSDDGGTWRRIRVVEFTSRFCEDPDPNKPNEFKMDKDLGEKFEIWKEHFIAFLIEFYKRYLVEGCKEPEEVLKCTRDYQRSNDIMMDFYEQEIEKLPGQEDAWVSVTDVHKRFNEWIKDNAPSMKNMITKKTLKAALEKHLKFMRIGGVECFYECRLRTGALYDMADDALEA